MADSWTFGWNQILTATGLFLSASIAFLSFRTFNRWKLEKLEERRIEIAFDALTIAYQTRSVFQHIRSPLTANHELDEVSGNDESKRRQGQYLVALKRIAKNKDFFERVWHLQPKCMAVFGRQIDDTFMKLHKARRHIEVAAEMLAVRAIDPDIGLHQDDSTRKLYHQLRLDIWDQQSSEANDDRVGKMLKEFETELENVAKPIVDKKYKAPKL